MRASVVRLLRSGDVVDSLPKATKKAKRHDEEDGTREIIELAESLGWTVWYLPDWAYRLMIAALLRGRRRSDRKWPSKGEPDLRLLRGDRFLQREIKIRGGRISPEQKVAHDALRAAGIDVAVWWLPKDWDVIRRELA